MAKRTWLYFKLWSLFDAWHPLFRKAWFVAVLAFIQSWARMPRHETIPSASLTTCQEQSRKAALCVPSRWIIQPNGDHQRSLQLDYARVQGQNAGCFACPTRLVYISLASGTVSVFLCHRFYHALVFLPVFFFLTCTDDDRRIALLEWNDLIKCNTIQYNIVPKEAAINFSNGIFRRWGGWSASAPKC